MYSIAPAAGVKCMTVFKAGFTPRSTPDPYLEMLEIFCAL